MKFTIELQKNQNNLIMEIDTKDKSISEIEQQLSELNNSKLMTFLNKNAIEQTKFRHLFLHKIKVEG